MNAHTDICHNICRLLNEPALGRPFSHHSLYLRRHFASWPCGLKKYKRAGRFQTDAGLIWNKVRRSDWKWRTSRELRWGHSDGDNGVFHLVFTSAMQTECRRWWRSCRVETCRWSVCSLLARTDKVQGSGESCCCCQFIYLRGDKAAQPLSAAVAQFSPFRKSKLAFCGGNNYVSQSFLRKEEKYGGCFHILNVCRGGANGLPTEIYEVMSTLTFLCVRSPITSHMLLTPVLLLQKY